MLFLENVYFFVIFELTPTSKPGMLSVTCLCLVETRRLALLTFMSLSAERGLGV